MWAKLISMKVRYASKLQISNFQGKRRENEKNGERLLLLSIFFILKLDKKYYF